VTVSDIEDTNLTLEVVQAPTKGSVEIFGRSLIYTPGPNEFGADIFALAVRDTDGGFAFAEFTVGITAVNDAPTAKECGPFTVEAGQSLDINAKACGTDIDQDILTIKEGSVTTDNGTTDRGNSHPSPSGRATRA